LGEAIWSERHGIGIAPAFLCLENGESAQRTFSSQVKPCRGP
jgi:hypothetical protein